MDKNEKLEEKTSQLEDQVKQNWGVGWMKIHNMQKEIKQLKQIDTGKNLQIRDLEISWHQLKQTDMEKNHQIQDLEQTCDELRSMDKASQKKIKALERLIARLESNRGPSTSLSRAPNRLNSTDRESECPQPEMEEMPISNVFLICVQGIVLLKKKILRQLICSALSNQKQFFLACFSFLVFLFINSIL